MAAEKETELTNALVKVVSVLTRFSKISDGKIIAVDEESFTCDIQLLDSSNDITYYSVPLKVQKGVQDSIVEIPENGSYCVFAFLDGKQDRPQLLFAASVLKYLVNCDQIIYNGGELAGMVKVIDLTSKLNAIEQDLNNLKQVFSGWTTVPNDGGAALKAAAATWYGTPITKTQQSDIEDTKITH